MNVKKKGNIGENNFAKWLFDNGIKAHRNSSSGGNEYKSDIHNSMNANFEVKTVKRINLQEAWKQSVRDASQAHSTPYLVIHFDGMPKDDWLMVMSNHDWLDLIKRADTDEEIIKEDSQSMKTVKYQAQFIKEAVNKILKTLNKDV